MIKSLRIAIEGINNVDKYNNLKIIGFMLF